MTLLDGREMYIDTTSIVRNGSEVTVWVKEVFTGTLAREAHVAKVEEAVKQLTPGKTKNWDKKWAKKYADFYYTISKRVYDCVNSRSRTLEATDYNSKEKKIAKTMTVKDKKEWWLIDNSTIGDVIMFEVCDNY